MNWRVSGIVLAACFASALAGCSSAKPPSAETGDTAQAPRDDSGPALFKLNSALRNYRLPTSSIAPTLNANPPVDEAIARMASVAIHQALIFDGSRADEGIVIVGRQGRRQPMLIAVAVYTRAGRLGVTDATHFSDSDAQEGQRIRDKFLGAL